MIKINLLGAPKPVARAAEPSAGLAPEAIILPGAFLVVLALIAGFVYWYMTRQIDTLNTNLRTAKAEQARLAGIKEQNARYEQQLSQLQLRLDTIHLLQSSRVGPVELMHTLGALVDRSNDLYLLTVTPKADRLAIEGVANSTEAIANFLAALVKSGNFVDVQLRQSYQDDRASRVSFKFSLDCVYKQSSTENPTAPATSPGRRSGG